MFVPACDFKFIPPNNTRLFGYAILHTKKYGGIVLYQRNRVYTDIIFYRQIPSEKQVLERKRKYKGLAIRQYIADGYVRWFREMVL